MRSVLFTMVCLSASCSVYSPTPPCEDHECGGSDEPADAGDNEVIAAIDGTGDEPPCVLEQNCVAPRVETLRAEPRGDTALVVRARLDDPGNVEITAAGACAAERDNVAPGSEGTVCVTVSVDVLLGTGATIEHLASGTRHFVTAWVQTPLGRVEGDWIDAWTLPAAPGGLTASDGTSVESVALEWTASVGATSYVIYRDGVELGMADEPGFNDASAAPGGLPLAPTLTASQGTFGGYVRLVWPDPGVVPGTTHTYQVVALGPGGESLAAEDTGFRRGPPIETYEWRALPDGEWTRSRLRDVWDLYGPLCPPIPVETTVSHGTVYGEIEIEAEPLPIPEMPRLSYEVRAINAFGTGPASEPAVGWKAFSGVLLELEWGPPEITVGGGVFPTIKVYGAPGLVQRWAPDTLGTAYDLRYVTRSSNCEKSASEMRLGWAAECDEAHPCAGERECRFGVCVTPGFSPAFAVLAWKGSEIFDYGRSGSEVRHRAMLTRDYEWSRTEVTQGEWTELMGQNPSHFADCGPDCPVENITRYSAMAYANAVSEMFGIEPCYVFGDDCVGDAAAGTLVCPSLPAASSESGNVLDCEGFRLPLETEWEFAAKFDDAEHTTVEGGFVIPGCEGDENAVMQAWYCANAEVDDRACLEALHDPARCVATHPVASLAPNRYGVFDIYGNVSEWAWDGGGAYPSIPAGDLYTVDAIAGGSGAVTRGGWFGTDMRSLRAAARYGRPHDYRGPEVGLRLVRTR